MPADFIPSAEQTGLIVPLGAWALTEAMRQSRIWQSDPKIGRVPWMSVNVSLRELSNPSLTRSVAAALSDHDLAAKALYLEVTESQIVADPEAALSVLTELQGLGTGIAIDDFGTGYSSLGHLRAASPASLLKIDRSFIATIAADQRTQAIVSGVIDMAHALGIDVVAEGIETADQLAVVGKLGCDIGQGYYLARPRPAEELYPLLTSPSEFAAFVCGGCS